jgi:hypothetical protein
MVEFSGAICDLLEHEPTNKDVGDKIMNGICPDCGAGGTLVRWCPGSGFHDLCTHFHCVKCDTDYCWPIAWDPPMPIIKMKGTLHPLQRREIIEAAQRQHIVIPDYWEPLLVFDTTPKKEEVKLRCFECQKEITISIITDGKCWHWQRGKWPRGWDNTDNDLENGKIYARCKDHRDRLEPKS